MNRIVLASNNPGKLREIGALLEPLALEVVAQSQLGVDEAEENGLTFVENALIKARHAARVSGLPALADDSGLEVDALHGAPGIRSARFAGPGSSDADNVARLLRELEGTPRNLRSARFVCVLVWLRHADDPTPLISQGIWNGRILEAAQGDGGFGYDPVFYVPDHDCAAAELPAETKNRISHRARALNGLLEQLKAR